MSEKPDVFVLVLNLLTVTSALCKICFFRLTLHGVAGARNPRLHREYLGAATVAAIAVVAWLLVPTEAQGGDLTSPSYAHNDAAFTFVIVLIGYYAIVAARVINWTRQLIASWIRHRRSAPAIPHEAPTRRPAPAQIAFYIGIVIIGVGEVVRFVSDIFKLTSEVLARFVPEYVPALTALKPLITTGVRFGHTSFYIGALLPLVVGAITALGIAVRQARNSRRVTPLWEAITAEFPDLAYRGTRGVGGRFYRRELEIRDGLVLLERYFDPAVAEYARQQNGGNDADEAVVAVALIRGALRAKRAGNPVDDPHPIPISRAETRSRDVAWLLRVADAFAVAEKAEGNFVTAGTS
ncbi:MAB_1171c family putative transporter [Pseudonocardia sp. C8]|uniref:MAB_1171c family putative transporter n=1 Tax=Pseudonocardia sp. C8 TaxID=2762759 RepID=UPI001C92C66C|nr:MAB_1171c family putative transporter [Pseudonocardia sp. C8]